MENSVFSPTMQRRQRRFRLFSTTGFLTTAALAYGTYKLSQWLNDDHDEKDPDAPHQAQHEPRSNNATSGQQDRISARDRALAIEKCLAEIHAAHGLFLKQLHARIESYTKISKETKALKRMRKQKAQRPLPQSQTVQEEGTINPNAPHYTGDATTNGPNSKKDEESEEELWNIIKIKQMTRLMSTMYAHNIIYLVLYVQAHLLAGRLAHSHDYDEGETGMEQNDDSERKLSSHIQVLTNTFNHFFNIGVQDLIKEVEGVVAETLSDWHVVSQDGMLGNLSLDEFEGGITAIRNHFESQQIDQKKERVESSFARFMIPDETNEDGVDALGEDALTRSILDESWDILESPLFRIAEQDSLNESFYLLRHAGGLADIFCLDASIRSVDGITEKIPLANVLTKLKGVIHKFNEPPLSPIYDGFGSDWRVNQNSYPNVYVKSLSSLSSIKELGDISFN